MAFGTFSGIPNPHETSASKTHAERMRSAFESVQHRLREVKSDRERESMERGPGTYELDGRSYAVTTLKDAINAEATEALHDVARLKDIIEAGSDEYQKSVARKLYELQTLDFKAAQLALSFMDGGEALLQESGIAEGMVERGEYRLKEVANTTSQTTLH